VHAPVSVGLLAGAMALGEVVAVTGLYALFGSGGWATLALPALFFQAGATVLGGVVLHVALRHLWVTPGEELLGRVR